MSNRARPSDATIRGRTPRPTHIVRAPLKAALRSRETSEWLHEKKLALRSAQGSRKPLSSGDHDRCNTGRLLRRPREDPERCSVGTRPSRWIECLTAEGPHIRVFEVLDCRTACERLDQRGHDTMLLGPRIGHPNGEVMRA